MNIVWSYGYGIPGTKEGYLSAPGTAEELDGDKVLICEEYNHDVIIVDKGSKKIIWQFGERGVSGEMINISTPPHPRTGCGM